MDSATPFWVAQRPSVSPTHLEVTHSHDGRAVDRVAIATDNDVGRAASTAHAVPSDLVSALADDGPHVIVVPAALRMFGPTHM